MSDLSNKTVEELRRGLLNCHLDAVSVCEELAIRLAKARAENSKLEKQLAIATKSLRSIETENDHGGEMRAPMNFPVNIARAARVGIERLDYDSRKPK